MKVLLLLLSVICLGASGRAHAQTQFFDPTPYQKPSDVPAGFADQAVHIEHFEDAEINGDLLITGSIVPPSGVTDSVDYDDGSLDGFGRGGHTVQGRDRIRVRFATPPSFAGMVWTDGPGPVTFEAFDRSGVSLGIRGPFALTDGANTGATAEDRFFGIRHAAGIGAIEFRASGGIEIDHVQWQVAPDRTPSTALARPDFPLFRAATVIDLASTSSGALMVLADASVQGSDGTRKVIRLNANGTLDTGFRNPLATGVTRIAVDSAQRLYTFGTQVRRFSAAGLPDLSFTVLPEANGAVAAIAEVADGWIVGGNFTSLGGQPRSRLAKVLFNGSLDPGFAPGANGEVTSLLVKSAGEIFVGGRFTTLGGETRSGLAKVNGSGVVLSDWNPILGGTAPAVSSLAINGDQLYVGGAFNAINSIAAFNTAKLSTLAGATVDQNWAMRTGNSDIELRVENGALYAFNAQVRTGTGPILDSLLSRANLSTGIVDTAFVVDANSAINDIADNGSGLWVGGNFKRIQTTTQYAIAALNNNATVGSSQPTQLEQPGVVNDSVAVGDFTVMVGSFSRLKSLSGSDIELPGGIVGLTSDGRITLEFNPDVSGVAEGDLFRAVEKLPNGDYFVGGTFGVLRLNPFTGTQVSGFNFGTSTSTLLLTSDALYVAGVGATFRLRRLPLTGGGTADPNFDAGAVAPTFIQADSPTSLVVAGIFNTIGGGSQPRLARINALTGQLIASFAPDVSTTPNGLALDGKGGVWMSGGSTLTKFKLTDGSIDTLLTTLPTQAVLLGVDKGMVYYANPTNNKVLRISDAGGASDPKFGVVVDNTNLLRARVTDARITLTGGFEVVASQTRSGIASLVTQDRIHESNFE